MKQIPKPVWNMVSGWGRGRFERQRLYPK